MNADGWKKVRNDPTAGVPLMPARVHCPRCGIDKGTRQTARRGLCADCVWIVRKDAHEREAWGIGAGRRGKAKAAA